MAQTTIAPNGVFATEIFSGESRAAVMDQMDARFAQLKDEGHRLVRRTAIGRNSPCPCGSRLKFKKCCVGMIPAPGLPATP